MIRRVYLAGAITKDPDYVRKFANAAAALRHDGFDVINPVEIDDPEQAAEALLDPYGPRYEELLARDLAIIEDPATEAVVVLSDWAKSSGAQREVTHAFGLDKPVLRFPNLDRIPNPLPAEPLKVRTFDTGATRDTDEGKPDYEGYLSPRVLRAYGRYMLKHSEQSDGSRRPSDNWQKGIPLDAYMKSGWRHFLDWWDGHRGTTPDTDDREASHKEALEEALCALIFNASGYLHELLGNDDEESVIDARTV